MAIPDFQSIMLPLLKSLGDNEEKLNDQLRENIITHFKISESEQNEKIPSGKQSLYKNRIAWAIAYLKMANLIKATGIEEAKIRIGIYIHNYNTIKPHSSLHYMTPVEYKKSGKNKKMIPISGG